MTNGAGLQPRRSRTAGLPVAGNARYLLIALLILAAIFGVQAATPAVSWRGPLRTEGFDLAISVEAVLAILLLVLRRIEKRSPRPQDPAATIRIVLRRAIGTAMVVVVSLVLAGLVGLPLDKAHLNPLRLYPSPSKQTKFPPLAKDPIFGGFSQLDLRVLAYVTLALITLIPILASFAYVRLSRFRRLRRGLRVAVPDGGAGSLIDTIEAARRALRSVTGAQAAIIACYLAMETSLAGAGAPRGAAETPDELLARAVASQLIHRPAAAALTRLFYEARFSTHELPQSALEEALAVLDAISAEVHALTAASSGPVSARGPASAHGQSAMTP